MKKVIALTMAAAMVSSMAVASFAADTHDFTAPVRLKDSAAGSAVGTAGGTFGADVRPDKTLYLDLDNISGSTGAIGSISGEDLVDEDFFSFKTKKEEGSKYIKSIARKEVDNKVLGGRTPVIEIKLNDFYDDNDHKVELKFTFSAKSKYHDENSSVASGDKYETTVKFFVSNEVDDNNTDLEYTAGTGGIVVKPVANDDNEIVWSDENRDLAKLKFEADSDVNKFFPKLSTKWSNDTYRAMFADQDAYLFDFVANPTISATARPELTIYNPFVNDDDELTVDPEDVVIYQIANNATLAASSEEVELATAILDGRLIDVTDKFTAGENDDGDYVFTTKTRTLGTYIICEKAPSEEAFDEAAGETPETNVPAETVKPNPGTGR